MRIQDGGVGAGPVSRFELVPVFDDRASWAGHVATLSKNVQGEWTEVHSVSVVPDAVPLLFSALESNGMRALRDTPDPPGLSVSSGVYAEVTWEMLDQSGSFRARISQPSVLRGVADMYAFWFEISGADSGVQLIGDLVPQASGRKPSASQGRDETLKSYLRRKAQD